MAIRITTTVIKRDAKPVSAVFAICRTGAGSGRTHQTDGAGVIASSAVKVCPEGFARSVAVAIRCADRTGAGSIQTDFAALTEIALIDDTIEVVVDGIADFDVSTLARDTCPTGADIAAYAAISRISSGIDAGITAVGFGTGARTGTVLAGRLARTVCIATAVPIRDARPSAVLLPFRTGTGP